MTTYMRREAQSNDGIIKRTECKVSSKLVAIIKQIKKEIASGLAVDPAQTNMMDTMQQQNTAFQPELQNIQAQDSAAREAESADDSVDREVDKAKRMPKP